MTDLPAGKFLTGGQAWDRYRFGAADPGISGLSLVGESGDWWIAANLIRDAAAVGNVEVLPWDCWGAMPEPDDLITSDLAALFDRLARLTENPDASLYELRQLFQDDDRVRVPPLVRNYLRGTDEPL